MLCVRSSSPFTRRLSFSASNFRSQTWCAGVCFFGIHTFPLSVRCLFSADKSITRREEEYCMTYRYSNFVSVARFLRVVGWRVDLPSSSESSESDGVSDRSNGGVGGRVFARKGGNAWISFRRLYPLRYAFSFRKNRTAPRSASICSGRQ